MGQKKKKTSSSKPSSTANTPRGSPPKQQKAKDVKKVAHGETAKLKREYSTETPIEFATKVNFNEDESTLTTFFIQTYALCWKNYLIFKRKTRLSLFMLATPFFVGWLLNLITEISAGLQNSGVIDFQEVHIGKIERCINGYYQRDNVDCLTLAYGMIGDSTDLYDPKYQRYHDLMKIIAKNNDFELGKDVKPLTAGGQTAMMDHLMANQNKTMYSVMWCHDYWKEKIEVSQYEVGEDIYNFTKSKDERSTKVKNSVIPWHMPCKFDEDSKKDMWAYYIIYNMTLGPSNLYTSIDKPMNKNPMLMSVKLAVDNGILEYKAKQKGLDYVPKINQTLQSFPYIPDRLFKDFDVLTMYGSFYVIMVPLCSFMIFFDELVREKTDNLRKGLQMLGTQDNAYWMSWFITGCVMNTLMAIEMIVVGRYYYAFDCFVKAPFYVWFLVIIMTSTTYLLISFYFVSIIQNKTQAFTVNFGVVLCSMVANIILCEPTTIKKVFFNLDMPKWVSLSTNLFYLNPCFQFGKLFGDITNLLCAHFDPLNMNWVQQDHTWETADLWYQVEGVFISKDRYKVDSMFATFMTLVYDMILFGFLFWYWDNVLSMNRGAGKGWFFFLSPSFWCPKSTKGAKGSRETYDLSSIKSVKSVSLNTAVTEKRNVIQDEQKDDFDDVDGIRVLGLTKTFKSIISQDEVKALKNVYFNLKKGELLGIMGHNGAGKSTLINLICGAVNKDSGNARIFKNNIEDDISLARKRMGVVTQFDVLWDELTGIEHMQLFQILKRVDIEGQDKLIEQRLSDVGLSDAGNLTVNKYSGGMRRRISVALSTMGNPDVILMDEPTTGMDPVSRRHVWTLIQRLKHQKSIIMTTHAMEEAEILSDKLLVLNEGEVKCVGSPLELKKMLGKGYRISMICKKENVQQVLGLTKALLPSSTFLETSGESGGLVFNLPINKVNELGSVFTIIDQQKGMSDTKNIDKKILNLSNLISDVGVSQTTLEEVFMEVSKE